MGESLELGTCHSNQYERPRGIAPSKSQGLRLPHRVRVISLSRPTMGFVKPSQICEMRRIVPACNCYFKRNRTGNLVWRNFCNI